MGSGRARGGRRKLEERAHLLALRLGLDVRRARTGRTMAARRLRMIERSGVDAVVDVGANRGQWASRLRAGGYGGPLVSLEPLATPFAELRERADGDPGWRCLQLALGEETGTAEINVAGNVVSSSILESTARQVSGAPGSVTVGTEEIEVARLDDRADEVLGDSERALMKLDVQGYELAALRGAELTLERIHAVEAELSLVELYAGQPLLPEVFNHLRERGYDCVGLEPGFTHPESGDVLQADGLFVRPSGERAA